ncbi:hypothetical protein CDL12_27316 [Handroanthus impetiginosus]|uniref:Uncharacterized protein n=1 Tax=Handroanthus impetiginosus TaxID=429701 RepID=A0A2G9G4R0_9LAMI|nr:hypothetical protein CDL12_27316 [Handroanthus impetiginosus]
MNTQNSSAESYKKYYAKHHSMTEIGISVTQLSKASSHIYVDVGIITPLPHSTQKEYIS